MIDETNKNEHSQDILTNDTFEKMMIQRDEWEDTRNNKRLNQGTFTNIWLFIIAIYCLFNLIKEIIPIILSIKFLADLF